MEQRKEVICQDSHLSLAKLHLQPLPNEAESPKERKLDSNKSIVGKRTWDDIVEETKIVISVTPIKTSQNDTGMTIEYAHQKFYEIFGFSEEILLLPFAFQKLCGPETTSQIIVRIKNAILDGKNNTEYLNLYNFEKTPFRCHLTITALTGGNYIKDFPGEEYLTTSSCSTTSSFSSPSLSPSPMFFPIKKNSFSHLDESKKPKVFYAIMTIRVNSSEIPVISFSNRESFQSLDLENSFPSYDHTDSKKLKMK